MIKALSVSLKVDLSFFSSYLFGRGIGHKITEESGVLMLWVSNDNDARLVQYYYQQWKNGELTIVPAANQSPRGRGISSFSYWKTAPATVVIVTISILITLLMYLPATREILLRWLTFTDPWAAEKWQHFYSADGGWANNFQIQFSLLGSMLAQGQWWRLITPIFLHFSLLHIAFNAAMFLFFGQRIESRHGRKTFLFLTLVFALFSNLVQYFSGSIVDMFGGLSGIIYGFIGYCWIRSKDMHDGYNVPPGIYVFMVIWLIVGYLGVLNGLGLGALANGAHAGGLIAGMIAGFLSSGKSH